MQHGCKLPAEVARSGDPGIQAVTAGRDVLVCGTARQKHPAATIALGDQQMRRPCACEQDFVIKVATSEVTQRCAGIDHFRSYVVRKPRLECPDVAIVLRYKGALG